MLIAAPAKAQSWGFLFGKSESSFDVTYHPCTATCGWSLHYGSFSTAIGVFGRFPLTSFLSFEPELLRTEKGSGTGHSPELALSYIEVPMLVSLFPAKRSPTFTRPFLRAGGAVGYLMDQSLTAGPESSGGYIDPDTVRYKVRPWEVSGVVGIGIEHRFANQTIAGIELRGSWSLANIGYIPQAKTVNLVSTLLFRLSP